MFLCFQKDMLGFQRGAPVVFLCFFVFRKVPGVFYVFMFSKQKRSGTRRFLCFYVFKNKRSGTRAFFMFLCFHRLTRPGFPRYVGILWTGGNGGIPPVRWYLMDRREWRTPCSHPSPHMRP